MTGRTSAAASGRPGPAEFADRAPGPDGLPLVGSALALQRDTMGFFRSGYSYGDDLWSFLVPTGLRGRMLVHVVLRPEHAEYVLKANAANYRKSAAYRRLGHVVGEGLVTSEGEFWRRQRRLAQPAYHHRRLALLAETITGATDRMLEDRWRPAAERGEAVDVAEDMRRLALEIVGRAMLSVNLSDEASDVSWAVGEFLAYADRHIRRIYSPPPSVPTPANLRFKRAGRAMDELVYGIIRERRASGEDRGDLISMLLLARDEETGEGLSDQQVRDEVMTTLVAGHETTAAALAWASWLLATHPQAEREMHREVGEVLAGRPAGSEDVGRDGGLRYTKHVFEETLRVYPPAWMIARIANEEDEIAGYRIPKDSRVAVSPYLVHRNPDVWPEPARFDPDRFSPERSEGRHRFAHIPFGGGPRGCIGVNLARMEGPLVLATLAQRCRLLPARGARVRPNLGVTLRPAPAVPMLPSFSPIPAAAWGRPRT
jgi:cytochrome P450